MSVIVKCGGGDNVRPEVEYQTPVITQILEGLVGKAQGANATADKILEGYSAYVGQELVEGTLKPVHVAALFGHTKASSGEVTSSSDLQTITINHNLGEIPKMIFYYTPDNLIGTTYTKLAVCNSDDMVYGYRGANAHAYSSYDYYDIGACVFEEVNETSAVLTSTNKSYKFKAGSTYYWLALA